METKNISRNYQRTLMNFGSALLFGCTLLSPVAQATVDKIPAAEAKVLSQSEIINQATSQSADAHVITKNKDGSVRIPSPMQDMVATLTPKGANFQSVDNAKGDFALYVNGLGRDKGKLTKIKPGKITNDEKIARLFHNNLIEEFTTSAQGIRQDFVVQQSPKGKGQLMVELELKGATAKLDEQGAMLTLEGGRKLAYHSLLVADAKGTTLPAHFALKDNHTLRIIVDDKGAEYPVRIDPTITDADWFSLGAAMPAPNSHVRALVSDGAGNLYIGGEFYNLVGIADTAYIAKWDGSAWSALGSGMDMHVYALAWDGTTLYAGGEFTTAGGVAANHIAQWDGSAWSTLGVGMDYGVYALAWDGSTLYAGGWFTTAGGVSASLIAQWDGSAWNTLGSGVGDPVTEYYDIVQTLVWDGSTLYAGGKFTTAGGVAASNIAQWDGSVWSALGSGINYPGAEDWDIPVYALAWDGSTLYAGGRFTSAGGVSVNHIAQWDGSAWSALGSGMNDPAQSWEVSVRALTWDGSILYAGGDFITAGGITANHIAQWDGSAWTTLGSGMSAYSIGKNVNALLSDGSTLYVGGTFHSAGNVSAYQIAQWDGSAWSALGSGMNGDVHALAWNGSTLYVGGDFITAGGVSANRIAQWDGSTWSALDTGINDSVLGVVYDVYVHSLAWDGTNLFAGGNFTTAGGMSANSIAQWDGSTWSALGSGIDGSVRALAWDGSTLYAGGSFTYAGGIVARNIAQWNGSSWNIVGIDSVVNMNSSVSALLWNGSTLYAGGFSYAGGVNVNYIAQWDGSAWSSLGAGMDGGGVSALAWDGTNLYAGGSFTTAGGVAANRVAQWDGSAWSALGAGVDNSVGALAWGGSTLYAGGWLTTAGSAAANYIAQWDGSAWSTLGSGVSWPVYALTWTGSTLYAGGAFITAGDKDAGYVAGINMGTPDPLLFTDLTDVALSTVTSSEILDITGLLIDVDISVTGGEYNLNSTGWTSASGTASNNDTLQLRTTSSASYNTATDIVISVGDGGDTWSVTTLTDTAPDAFSFVDQLDVDLDLPISSAAVVITGLGASSPTSIVGGEYSVNGGAFVTSGLVNNNDSVVVRVTSSTSELTETEATLTIGGISDTFTVTTAVEDGIPDGISLAGKNGVERESTMDTEIHTITGINTTVSFYTTDWINGQKNPAGLTRSTVTIIYEDDSTCTTSEPNVCFAQNNDRIYVTQEAAPTYDTYKLTLINAGSAVPAALVTQTESPPAP